MMQKLLVPFVALMLVSLTGCCSVFGLCASASVHTSIASPQTFARQDKLCAGPDNHLLKLTHKALSKDGATHSGDCIMKHKANFAIVISAGIAMACMAACAPTTHVTETTTTRQYDTTNPPIVVAPVAEGSTTTTTQYNNGTVQRTYSQPAPYSSYSPPDQSSTTVTTDANDGTVQKRTTTTYAAPY
jgi:hypothetical protein